MDDGVLEFSSITNRDRGKSHSAVNTLQNEDLLMDAISSAEEGELLDESHPKSGNLVSSFEWPFSTEKSFYERSNHCSSHQKRNSFLSEVISGSESETSREFADFEGKDQTTLVDGKFHIIFIAGFKPIEIIMQNIYLERI